MTVLIVPVRYMPHVGGIETLLHHTLPRLRERGHEPVIVTESGDDRTSAEVIDGVPVYRLPFFAALRSYDPAAILDNSRRLREIEADHHVTLRHVHGLDFNMFFVAWRHRRAPLPLMISLHGTLDVPFPFSPITLRMLGGADVVTAVSNGVRDSLAATIPTLAERVHVIPNAIAAAEDVLPWPADGHLFCAGRLEEQKGFDVAIDALARLAGDRPDLRLLIAGRGTGETALRRHAERVGVAARVRFLGTITREEVRATIDGASIVLVPSRSMEGFSMIALEAAHLARPVVATSVGGLGETVEDGLTGVLVPPDDPECLAHAIGDLLADPMRAAAMSKDARRRACRFDVDWCADAYAEMYRTLDHDGAASLAAVSRSGPTGQVVGG
jgi:glycogen(starch) synthase